MAVSLQARTLPALAGWSWISGGFALFRRNPPLMTALTMTYLLVMVSSTSCRCSVRCWWRCACR